MKIKSFIKWAGGKGQLLNKFKELYPQELINGEINTFQGVMEWLAENSKKEKPLSEMIKILSKKI